MDTMTKPVTKRDLKKIATAKRAIEAARKLWIKPGSYNKIGIREIAAEMKMSTGAVFANFEGKDHLWMAAFECPPPVDSFLTRSALAAALDTYPGAGQC